MNLVTIKFGSHLYGTQTPTSDTDYKSVYVPNAYNILLQRVQDSVHSQKMKAEGAKNSPTDIDHEYYSLQRYLSLLAEGQTVAIDMLFAPNPESTSSLWKTIQNNKEKFLTKKSASFVGYCRTQANKYGIKGSRVAAAKAAMELFDRERDLRGTTAKVSELFEMREVEIDEHTKIVTKETTQGRIEWYFECCNRMVGFHNTLKEAAIIYRRIYENYGDRARLAQSNEGIDWKALSHAVRVSHEAIELLRTHKITFPLPNAEHVKEIKLGKLPYQTVANEIEHLLVEVEKAAAISTLRDEPDNEFIDSMVEDAYLNQIWQEYL